MSAAAGERAAGGTLRIGFVAGESSGDQLGAALIDALRARVPRLECFGVAGPRMIAAGCDAWASAEELAVMGLTEVLRHLPRLLRLRRTLVARFVAARPQVFVGIDGAGPAHRAVCEPAGLGVAPGTCAHHRARL
jgi:lipid-A-disaccharide synthase